MKKLILYIISLAIISCNTNSNTPAAKQDTAETTKLTNIQEGPAAPTPVITPLTSEEKASTIASFREFRDAVYHHDKEKVKTFIDFPITAENNEVWYLVQDNIDQTADAMSRPFTEVDFDKYFNKVFDKSFINSILKIKADSLFGGNVSSPDFLEGDTLMYNMNVRFNPYDHTHTIDVSMYYETYDRGEGKTESSTIYRFDIVKGHLKWRGVRMVG